MTQTPASAWPRLFTMVPVNVPGCDEVTGEVETDLDPVRGALAAEAVEPGMTAAAVDPMARIVMTRKALT